MKSTVTAVIVVYNDTKDNTRLLQCILNSTLLPTALVVIDNSDQITPTEVKAIFANCSIPTYYYRNEKNTGSAGGFALGLEIAYSLHSEWIWMHDQDGYPAPDCLDQLITSQKSNNSAIVMPVIHAPEGYELPFFRINAINWGYKKAVPATKLIQTVDAGGTAGILIHRTVMHTVGTYDKKNYFVGFEDWDYCYRAKEATIPRVLIKNAIYYHPDMHKKYRQKKASEHPHAEKKLLHFGYLLKDSTPLKRKQAESYIHFNIQHTKAPELWIDLLYSLFTTYWYSFILNTIDLKRTIKLYLSSLKIRLGGKKIKRIHYGYDKTRIERI